VKIVFVHSRIISFLILCSLSISLYSQIEGNNLVGGGLRVDRLFIEKSPLDGVRKDIDLGLNAKYLRNLSPIHARDSARYSSLKESKIPISRHWAGVVLGFSGYYVNSDSVLISSNDICIGPTFRYYATKKLFLETTTNLLSSLGKIKTVAPINASNYYVPWTKTVGLKCQIGAGVSEKLTENIYLEPMIGYHLYWRWLATMDDQNPYLLIDTSNNFMFSMSIFYSF